MSDLAERKNRTWPHLLLIFVVTTAVFSNTLGMGFVFDDIPLIKGPSPIKSLDNLPEMLTTGVSTGTNFNGAPPYYRPLFNLSLAFDYFIWQENPFGYHLTNVFLHGLVAIVVYLLACRLLQTKGAALAGGLVFAVHPVHAEAVAYVAARNEMLCALFLLCAFLFYLRYRETNHSAPLGLALLCFFLSLLGKEMSATLPALLFLYEAGVRKTSVRRAVLSALPFLLIVAAYLLIRASVLENSSWDSPPLPLRINTSLVILASYLRLLFVPVELKTLYDIPIQWSFLHPEPLIALTLLLAVIGVTLYSKRSNGLLFLALGWMLVTLLPVSGLPVFIKPALMAERYLYTPSIGFALCVGVLFTLLADWTKGKIGQTTWLARLRPPLLAGGCGVLLTFAVLTVNHNTSWQDQPTFWQQMIADAPDHPLGYFGYGNYLGRNEQRREMARMYQKSLSLTLKRQDELAGGYIQRGDDARAEQELSRLQGVGIRKAEVFNKLGILFMRQGMPDEAATRFRAALALDKNNPGYRQNLRMALQAASSANAGR